MLGEVRRRYETVEVPSVLVDGAMGEHNLFLIPRVLFARR
jgi:hypothetical protein